MITGLHHTGLVVSDLDAAIAFFTSQQAFAVASRFDLADTPENRAMLQMDDARARVALLRGTLGAIELFEYSDAGHCANPGREVYSAGIRHICLQQDLSDSLYDGFVSAGAASHSRPSGLGTGNSYVYIRDPEGNIIELEGVPWAPAAADRPWFAHTAIVSPDMPRLLAFYALLTGQESARQGAFGPDPKFDRVSRDRRCPLRWRVASPFQCRTGILAVPSASDHSCRAPSAQHAGLESHLLRE
ncbi:MAG: hypothetical protein Q27BB25_00110 [Blastomonas sp. CACIA14H2]|uniref:VOC family protein n=1 Tax=Blastomonas sp. CACIA14H2 TaxID=1419876 RepID=UPI0003D05F18|nr:MAG: hypothetical protein Q27BB25_00110 [Blastomonas sp. CACIA14H2]